MSNIDKRIDELRSQRKQNVDGIKATSLHIAEVIKEDVYYDVMKDILDLDNDVMPTNASVFISIVKRIMEYDNHFAELQRAELYPHFTVCGSLTVVEVTRNILPYVNDGLVNEFVRTYRLPLIYEKCAEYLKSKNLMNHDVWFEQINVHTPVETVDETEDPVIIPEKSNIKAVWEFIKESSPNALVVISCSVIGFLAGLIV